MSDVMTTHTPEPTAVSEDTRSLLRRAPVAVSEVEGWQMVPVEPTPEMLEPFARQFCIQNGIDPDEPQSPHGQYPSWYERCSGFDAQYRASLAAAPLPPQQQDVTEGWQDISTAPKGEPTEDVGCRGSSEWFLGKPAERYRKLGAAPFVVIRRRAWPNEDSWADNGDTHYVPAYFGAWMPLPAAIGATHG